MTKRAIFLILAMAATGVSLLAAQSNEVLDAVLGEAALSYANAAYLVGTASGHLPETIDSGGRCTRPGAGGIRDAGPCNRLTR